MKDTVDKYMKKLKPHRVQICKMSSVNDSCYVRNNRNQAIRKLNEQLEMIWTWMVSVRGQKLNAMKYDYT